MAEDRVQRKLTTILAADVEGYSRLMGANEEATLKTLKTYRQIIDGLIAKHNGRLVGTPGDAVLVEFPQYGRSRALRDVHSGRPRGAQRGTR